MDLRHRFSPNRRPDQNHNPTETRTAHGGSKECTRNDFGPLFDLGLHLVCAQMTDTFLAFSKQRGNDLITPVPEYRFPGLRPGDRWCLCVLRWREALDAGLAPPVILESTHISTLEFVDLEDLQTHAVR